MSFSSRRSPMRTLNVILLSLAFVIASGALFYFLYNLEPTRFPTIFGEPKHSGRIVYILTSKANERFIQESGYNLEAHQDNLLGIQKSLEDMGFSAKLIEIERLAFLKEGATLLALDLYAISPEQFEDIEDFLRRGGSLFFNYRFGYFHPDGAYVGPKRIEKITGLSYLQRLERHEANATFIVPKLLSPLGRGGEPQRSYLVRYDPIPLFRSATLPDALLSNWAITSPPQVEDRTLSSKEAGLMWHGRYKEGSWYYASFPTSAFLEMAPPQKRRYLKNAIDYLENRVHLVFYPFLVAKKGVFLSEDTEFKYPELIHFAKLCAEKNLAATLFCVASLAQSHKDLTKKAAQMPKIEIASHSLTHRDLKKLDDKELEKEIEESKEILEEIAKKEVIGFRPPKEHTDPRIKKALIEAGYRYVMERTKAQLLPFDDGSLVTIPRHGTDDYIYLVDREWTADEMVRQMVAETRFLCDINALFTLSIHTHLLGFKPNLPIVKRYLDTIAKERDLATFTGAELAKIAQARKHLTATIEENPRSIIITLQNGSDHRIENLRFRLYHPKIQKIEAVYSEILTVKAKIVHTDLKERYIDVEVERINPRAALAIIAPVR